MMASTVQMVSAAAIVPVTADGSLRKTLPGYT
jgi:hypothetical protein